MLRRADVELGKGKKVPEVCKRLGIAQQTYYRWRQKYGGMAPEMAKELKALQKENTRLKKLVADQALDNAILKETVLWVKQNESHRGLGCNASCSRCRFSRSKHPHDQRSPLEMLSPAGRRRRSTLPALSSASVLPAPLGGQDRSGDVVASLA